MNEITIKIVYFAWLRTILQKSQENCTLPKDIKNIDDLINFLCEKDEKYAKIFANKQVIRVAVNHEYCDKAQIIKDNDEVAFFPPVTGG